MALKRAPNQLLQAQPRVPQNYPYPEREEPRPFNEMQNDSFGNPKNYEPLEEPICVLKIELDGAHVEEIKVYENDDPKVIVQKFGKQFNLSDDAKNRLLIQI